MSSPIRTIPLSRDKVAIVDEADYAAYCAASAKYHKEFGRTA